MIKTISYLGLGTMDSGMASNLLRAGYDLTVWNRSAGGLIEKFAASLQSPTPALRVAEKISHWPLPLASAKKTPPL